MTSGPAAPAGGVRRYALPAAALLGSGALSTLCLVLLTSNRLRVISAGDSIFVTLFVQWQMLGLTIAKVGIDSVVFAVLAGTSGLRPELHQVWTRVVLPLSLAFGLASLYSFGVAGAIVCALSAAIDSWSAAQVAWRGARQEFRRVVMANLLNYPLFFGSLFAFSAAGWPGKATILGCFLASSIARGAYLRLLPVEGTPARISVTYEVGAQQGLNFLLFRGDQMFLGAVGISLFVGSQLEIGQLLFLARFPEIASSVAVALGALFIPALFVDTPGSIRTVLARWRITALRAVLCLVALLASYGLFLLFWKGPPLAAAMLPPFVLAALMVVPANAMTYSMLRGGYTRSLVRNLLLSLSLGGGCLALATHAGSVVLLAWSVPVQMTAFVLICATLPWTPHRPLHA